MAGYVTLRKYIDAVGAEMDRNQLEASGVRAMVSESGGVYAMLAGTSGGVRLEVHPDDVARAEQILAEVEVEVAHGYRTAAGAAREDDEADETNKVRCPRCELEYCGLSRPYLTSLGPVATALTIVLLPMMLFGKKRWRCQRCEHVWDDAGAGPARMTPLQPDDPRPVFRLRRAHPGMGLFVGLMTGVVCMMIIPGLGKRPPIPVDFLYLMAAVAPIVGWLIGRSIAADACSDPKCRAPLRAGVATCPGCKGSIAGKVRSAAEHYAAAADFRRDLAALRTKDAARPARKAKKKAKTS